MNRGSRAVFFDRDGTLNRSAAPGEYIRSPEELELLPGAAIAVGRVNAVGLTAILATNQRWLSAADGELGNYRRIEAKLAGLLAAEHARLDACYTCPHALGSCECRKPLPGLLLRAASELDLNLHDSYFIGDSDSDVQAGLAAGATTVLIVSKTDSVGVRSAHHVVSSVEDAVDLVLAEVSAH